MTIRVPRSIYPLGRAAIALVFVGLVASGCGVNIDESPRVIADAELPVALVEGLAPIAAPADSGGQFEIWMVEDDRLSSVLRPVSLNAEAVIESLVRGTFPREHARGITSAIDRATSVESVWVSEGGVAFVDLAAGSIVSTTRDNQKLAFAQIVWSLTGLSTVHEVVFSVAEIYIQIPTDRGTSGIGQALNRQAFWSVSGQPRTNFAAEPGIGPVIVPTPQTRPAANAQVDQRPQIPIWMISADTGELVRVIRRLDATPESILSSLLLGPDFVERETGIRTAIPPSFNVVIVDVNEADGTAFVDLAPNSLPEPGADEDLRAVAQIVYSLTELREINMVSISIAGLGVPMPTQTGYTEPESSLPLSRQDFSVLAADVLGVDAPDPETLALVEPADDAGDDTADADDAAEAGAEESPATDDSTVDASGTPTAVPAPTPTPTQVP